MSQKFAICRCQPVALSVALLLSHEKIFSVSAIIELDGEFLQIKRRKREMCNGIQLFNELSKFCYHLVRK